MAGLQILCPCCKGAGQIEAGAPVTLTPMQTRIYNAIRAAKHGIGMTSLADKVYADRDDGGPDFWRDAVRTQICAMNKRLVSAGEKIVSQGLAYKLVCLSA